MKNENTSMEAENELIINKCVRELDDLSRETQTLEYLKGKYKEGTAMIAELRMTLRQRRRISRRNGGSYEAAAMRKTNQRRRRSKLASGNNQTVPEFPREEFAELRNDQAFQQSIANKNLMEKLPSLASRKTQQPLPELQANDNRVENLAPSVPSQDDSMNDNDVNQHVTITVEAEQLLDGGESSRSREISGWTLLVTNLILEIASAVFDQMGYALIGMVLAFVALLLAAVELIHMAVKERIKRAGMRPLPLFHPRSTSTSAARKPVGTIVEYFGLAGAVWQCVYSTVEYIYTRQGKDNPIKMYLLPLIFLLCVVISKLFVDKRSIDESS